MKTRFLNMNRLFVPAFGLALALLGSVSEVLALENNSYNSTDVWPAEGNGRCSDYFSNAVVIEASTSDLDGNADYPDALPDPIEGEGAQGAPNPLDDDAGTADEIVNFEIITDEETGDAIGISSFTASTRINAVILKSSRKINIFVEPAGGVTWDRSLALDGDEGISAVSFCYGVTSFETEEEELVDLPACDTIITSGSDFGVCEVGEAFECDLNADDDNVLVSVDCCACNAAGAAACDPSLPFDAPNSCSFSIRAFSQILFGLNGRVVCYQTDRGERCYSY
jgi:hypothetical protein